MGKKFTARFPVMVTIEWPEDTPADDDSLKDAALEAVSPNFYAVDVGGLWAKCFVEADDTELEIEEGD